MFMAAQGFVLNTSCVFESLWFFFSSRRRHTRYIGDWSSDVCSSEAELGQQRGEHVLPHRVARAGMVEPDRTLLPLWLEALQEREVLGSDHLPRPLGREARPAGEVSEGDLPGDREVVVAGQADGG